MANPFVHVELNSTDVAKAKALINAMSSKAARIGRKTNADFAPSSQLASHPAGGGDVRAAGQRILASA